MLYLADNQQFTPPLFWTIQNRANNCCSHLSATFKGDQAICLYRLLCVCTNPFNIKDLHTYSAATLTDSSACGGNYLINRIHKKNKL